MPATGSQTSLIKIMNLILYTLCYTAIYDDCNLFVDMTF